MIASLRKVLYDSVHLHNILPLTSSCSAECLFCSHKQNPPGIEVYRIPHLTAEEIENLLVFLTPSRKIVIGESATRIVEGEPFTHPECLKILKKLRVRFPSALIQLTTNGNHLTADIITALKALQPLEVNLSLNSSSLAVRNLLMRSTQNKEGIKAVPRLSEAGITFHGSLVPLPWVSGWDDIERTVAFLDEGGAATIRAFIPGFTRYRLPELLPPYGWEEELREFLHSCRRRIKTPLAIEPPLLEDLRAEISGIVRGSAAARAGFLAGQEILSINGIQPFSRVEAFNMLNTPGRKLVTVSKGGLTYDIPFEKKDQERTGLVMDYDLSYAAIRSINQAVEQRKAQCAVVLASEWGAPLLTAGLAKAKIQRVFVKPVKNVFWGGTIGAAGLLMVDDLARAIAALLAAGKKPDLFLLPAAAFDSNGRDLRGTAYQTLTERFGVETQVV